jgi:TonB family protein
MSFIKESLSMRYFAFILFLLVVPFSVSALAQKDKRESQNTIQQLVFPLYPLSAIAAGIGGDVLVEVVIDEDGSVTGSEIKIGNRLLSNVVEQSVLLWKFAPGKGKRSQSFTVTFAIIPKDLPCGPTSVLLKMPDKITIFGRQ